MFDTNTHKTFSALNLTVICIKIFTCKNITLINLYYAFKTWWNTDSLTHQVLASHISSQMHPSPINLWRVILIFILFLLSAGNKVLNSLYYIAARNTTSISMLFDLHMLTKIFSVWFLNPSEYSLLTSNTFIHFSCYLLRPTSADLFLCYYLVFCRNSNFRLLPRWFWVSKYLTVDRSLDYSYPKIILLFFSIHTSSSLSFWFSLLDLASNRIGILSSTFPRF